MELSVNIENIEHNNIIYKLPVKNQNNNYKNYYKIILSTENFNLKYIILKIELKNFLIKKENNIFKLVVNENNEILKKLINFEKQLLHGINNTLNKKCNYSLKNELENKEYLYKFNKYPQNKYIYFKISGLWENNETIGLVYKLYYNISTENLSSIVF